MKSTQRLDDARLAEVLNERGMADLEAIRDLLQIAQQGGMLFTESLVTTSLVADWDLSRVVAEIFQLPFLPIGVIKPDSKLWEELDQPFLQKYGIVPLSRFGQVLTVAMPGLVPAEVLGMLSAQTDMVILPVVGTVETNRRWLLEHKSGTAKSSPNAESDWGALFDAGDENVQLSLAGDEDDESIEAGLETLEAITAGVDDEGMGDLEFEEADEDEVIAEAVAEAEEAETVAKAAKGEETKGGGGVDLPPMPEFG